MKWALILETPEYDLITGTGENPSLPQDFLYELQVLETLYPGEPAIGTQLDGGKKLLYCIVTTEIAKLDTYLQALFLIYELDWVVRSLQSWLESVPVMGDVPDPENFEKVIEGIVGIKAKVLVPFNKTAIFPYLNPRHNYDDDGNPTTEKAKKMNWFPLYQGQSEWRDEV